jgi:hypothetical protein
VKFWAKREVGPIKAIHPASGKVIKVYPQKDARIGSDLDLELRRLPGVLSWYLRLRDNAEKHFRDMKHQEHNVSEDLYAEHRVLMPKATETTIKMAVKKHPRMREAFRARMEAQDMHQNLASQCEAIEEKRWCLTGLTKSALMERGTKDHV